MSNRITKTSTNVNSTFIEFVDEKKKIEFFVRCCVNNMQMKSQINYPSAKNRGLLSLVSANLVLVSVGFGRRLILDRIRLKLPKTEWSAIDVLCSKRAGSNSMPKALRKGSSGSNQASPPVWACGASSFIFLLDSYHTWINAQTKDIVEKRRTAK